jgi:hypothetical protein
MLDPPRPVVGGRWSIFATDTHASSTTPSPRLLAPQSATQTVLQRLLHRLHCLSIRYPQYSLVPQLPCDPHRTPRKLPWVSTLLPCSVLQTGFPPGKPKTGYRIGITAIGSHECGPTGQGASNGIHWDCSARHLTGKAQLGASTPTPMCPRYRW